MKIFETGIKNWILDGKETHVQFRVRQTSIILRKNEIITDFIPIPTFTGKTRITQSGRPGPCKASFSHIQCLFSKKTL